VHSLLEAAAVVVNQGIKLITAQWETQAVVGEDTVINLAAEAVDADLHKEIHAVEAEPDVEEGVDHQSKRTRCLLKQESHTPVPRMDGSKNGVALTDIGLGVQWP
jgi:hypothetical protein